MTDNDFSVFTEEFEKVERTGITYWALRPCPAPWWRRVLWQVRRGFRR